MRAASKTRIQALEDELKTVRGVLSMTKADVNGARARIHTAVADFRKSPVLESYIEARRRQWVSEFHRSTSFMVEMQQATLDGANRVLDKLNPLHSEWNIVEEVKRPFPRPPD